MNTQSFDSYLVQNRERLLEDYKDFLRQPSVAATGQGITEMAALVARRFATLGADVKIIPTTKDGAPVVWAEIGEGEKTLLIYNHYDVQPAEPFDLWESPPFEPTIRDGRIYARGASDDKGELVTRIHAVEAWLATQGKLPCKIKWLVEGEEEVGSLHLHQWVEQHKDMLSSDGCLWEGGGFDEKDRFTLTMGVKGICYVQLHVKSVDHDLHSSLAPLAPNAAWRLIWALNTIKDADDNILIDGYKDYVREPSPAQVELLRRMPFEEEEMRNSWKVDQFLKGRSGLDALKALYFTPTATVCGITTGWQGKGTKTVLPAEATAKVDFRLVPDLTPEIVVDLLRKHLDKHGFSDVEIADYDGYRAEFCDVEAPIVKAAASAAKHVYGQESVIVPNSPGSGPMWSLSSFIGGVPVVSAGMAQADTRIHSPNENIILQNYYDGMRYIGVFLDEFSKA
jgi:acetylornithine deacetylase/succinyl-diaminopimelate desuccinylase-like protein